MSSSYSISSQNTGNAFNALMANVNGAAGESKLAIKPIEQVYQFQTPVLTDVDNDLVLDTRQFDFDFKIVGIDILPFFTSYPTETTYKTLLMLKLVNEKLEQVATTFYRLDDLIYKRYQLPGFIVPKNHKIQLNCQGDLGTLIFTIEPVLLNNRI